MTNIPPDGCPSGPAHVAGAWPGSSLRPQSQSGEPRWTPTTADPARSPDCGSPGKGKEEE